MSFRITTLLFGLFLGVLWIFGLMLALGRSSLDPGFVLPRLAKEARGTITFVDIASDGKHYLFTKTPDGWRLRIPPHEQQVRVDDGEIEGLIEDIRTGRHSNEETDINRNVNDERWGLASPKVTITLKNSEGREWQVFVGKESEDRAFAYLNSSERSNDVLAIRRSAIAKVLFDDINKFRLRRLLEAKEITARRIDLKETRDGKVSELIVEKPKEKTWWITKPPLGPADFEGSSAAGTTDQGVRGLLNAVTNIRVEDFEPIGSTVTVDDKNALLRIEVESDTSEGGKKDKDKTPGKTEVLLIGDKVRDKDQYFARLASDNSVVRVSSKQLEPIFALIKDPRPLRNHDIALLEPDAVDAVEIIRGKELTKLYKNGASWRILTSGEAPRQANTASITGASGLLSAIRGQHEIKDKDFIDADTPDKKKELEAKFATNRLEAKVIAWADSLQPESAKKDEKQEDKKDDKKEEKKETGGDDKKVENKDDKKDVAKDEKKEATKDEKKDGKDKKDEAKDDKTLPKFKEGAKPVVTLSFVKEGRDTVLGKREAPDNEPIYFNLGTAAYDKIVPRDLPLEFFDNAIKTFSPAQAVKLELSRAPLKDHKSLETFLLQHESKEKEQDKGKEPEKAKEAEKGKDKDKDKEPAKVDDKTKDQAKDTDKTKEKGVGPTSEWKLLEPKEFVGKGEVDMGEIDRVLSRLAGLSAVRWVQKVSKDTLSHYGLDDKHWTARVAVTLKKQEGDKEDAKPFILRLGDSSNKDTDKGAVFAFLEGTDYVFLVDSAVDKLLKDAEFRDRHVLKFDPAKVKELRVFVTTADKEIRKPVFERDADKAWKEKKDALGFKIDTRKVDNLLDTLSDLQAVRYLGVKGEPPKDYELGDAAPLRFEIVMEDGKTIHKVSVGAASEKSGPYYAQCDGLPGGVFLVSRDPFGELMGKVTYFRKD
jgi:Domain of unknown function (DUF4340)